MREQDSDGPAPMPPTAAEELSDLDALAIAAPNCPTCLVPMQPSGDGAALAWRCPECGLVAL